MYCTLNLPRRQALPACVPIYFRCSAHSDIKVSFAEYSMTILQSNDVAGDVYCMLYQPRLNASPVPVMLKTAFRLFIRWRIIFLFAEYSAAILLLIVPHNHILMYIFMSLLE